MEATDLEEEERTSHTRAGQWLPWVVENSDVHGCYEIGTKITLLQKSSEPWCYLGLI